MKTMGLRQLRIVAPERPLDEGIVGTLAVHAADLWEGAKQYGSLQEAVADCSIVVGTTRRTGRRRKDFPLTPEELGPFLASRPGSAAVVYGNERTGLEADELALCDLAVGIPSSDAFPSLNLSHAVQVCSYALFRSLGAGAASGGHYVPIDRRRLDELVSTMCDSLESLGFYKIAGRDDQERFFRELLSRAAPTIGETRYLETIFRKMARLARGLPENGVDEAARRTHN